MADLNDNSDKLNLDQSSKHWPNLFEPYGRFSSILFCLSRDQSRENVPVLREFAERADSPVIFPARRDDRFKKCLFFHDCE